MVLTIDRVEVENRPQLSLVPQSEPKVEAPPERVNVRATIKFLEAITGRKIRKQQKIDYQGLQSGKVSIRGESVDQYIGEINDALRDNPGFDAVAGTGYAMEGRWAVRAVQVLVRPGLTPMQRALLTGSIPSSVPPEVPIVYKEWDRLIPEVKFHKRVTHTNHRLLPGEDPRLRIP